ncbi:MAG: hypothetical protein ACRDVE_05900 [Actinocrinis sp.]
MDEATDVARQIVLARFIAVPFAILGPIVLVFGVVEIARGHNSMPRTQAMPLPIALFFAVAVVFTMSQLWWRRGFLRVLARRGGWRRGAAVVVSAGVLAFAGFMVAGETMPAIVGWLASAIAVMVLMMDRKSAGATAEDSPEQISG